MSRHYVVRVNDRNLRSSVHSPSCQVVTKNQPNAYHTHKVVADSAIDAAAQFDQDNDNESRELPATVVCPCAGSVA